MCKIAPKEKCCVFEKNKCNFCRQYKLQNYIDTKLMLRKNKQKFRCPMFVEEKNNEKKKY